MKPFYLCRHKEVVKLLRKTGAHFSREEMENAGTELCRSHLHAHFFSVLFLIAFINLWAQKFDSTIFCIIIIINLFYYYAYT